MKTLVLVLVSLPLLHCVSAGKLSCPDQLLSGFESKKPFFEGSVTAICLDSYLGCTTTNYSDGSITKTDVNGQTTLTAECTNKRQIFESLSISESNGHPKDIAITCCPVPPSVWFDPFEMNSDASNNTKLDCGDGCALQKITFTDPGDGSSTRAVATCSYLTIILP